MIGIMIGYWILTIIIGIIAAKGKTTSFQGMAMANHSLGTFLVFMTYMGAFAGGGLTMGIASMAFTHGISAQWYAMTQGLAFITFAFFVPKIRKIMVTSVPELLGKYFGLPTRFIAGIISIVGLIFLTAGQIISMSTVVAVATGMSLLWCMIVSTSVIIAITVYGGLISIAWADVFHGVLHIGGVLVAIPWILFHHGGYANFMHSLPHGYNNWWALGLVQISSWYVMYIVTAGSGQILVQKVWAAKDNKAGFWGVLLAGAFVSIYGIFTAIAGLAARIFNPHMQASEAYAWTMSHLVPFWIGAIVQSAAVAAIMSAGDAMLLGASIILANDIIPVLIKGANDSYKLLTLRISVVGLGALALLISLSGMNIVPANTFGMAIMGAPIFILVVVAIMRKQTKGVPVITCGVAAIAVWQLIGQPYNISSTVVGLIVSLVAYLVIQTVSRDNSPEGLVGGLD